VFHFVEVCHRASQCVTTCGSVLLVCCGVLLHFLEGVAACFGVLQCVVVRCSVLQLTAVCCSSARTAFYCVADCCRLLPYVSLDFSLLQGVALCCSVLQLQCGAVCSSAGISSVKASFYNLFGSFCNIQGSLDIISILFKM